MWFALGMILKSLDVLPQLRKEKSLYDDMSRWQSGLEVSNVVLSSATWVEETLHAGDSRMATGLLGTPDEILCCKYSHNLIHPRNSDHLDL